LNPRIFLPILAARVSYTFIAKEERIPADRQW